MQSGYVFTSASNNIFIGSHSGFSTTTGSENTFVGDSSGFLNTTGKQNSFFGRWSGASNSTASSNSFFGYQSGYLNTTGNHNTFVGDSAGYINTTGSQNLFLGFNSNPSANNFTNATAIGSKAFVSASNSMVLGSINGVNGATADTKVGIGTTIPSAKLHVSNGSFGGSYTPGFDDLIVEDNNSAYINILTPVANENGILFGLSDNTASGGIVYNNSSAKKGLEFRTFNNSTRMVIDSVGNVGIGTFTPSYTFHVVNNNAADGGFANGIVIENINASTGEAAISFKNTGTNGTGNKLWIVGLNQGRDLDFNYGTDLSPGNIKMVLDSTGNLGINNQTPAEKLDVTGNIKLSGEVIRPSTGAANLVPICYGSISGSTINSGTNNFTVSNGSTGVYTITITGESYTSTGYSTMVTPIGSVPIFAVSNASGTDLVIRIFNSSGTALNAPFNFVVYKN